MHAHGGDDTIDSFTISLLYVIKLASSVSNFFLKIYIFRVIFCSFNV